MKFLKKIVVLRKGHRKIISIINDLAVCKLLLQNKKNDVGLHSHGDLGVLRSPATIEALLPYTIVIVCIDT